MQTNEAVELFLTSRRVRNCTKNTIKWYRLILTEFCKQFSELPLDIEPIELFIGNAPGDDERKHGYFRALRALYRFLFRRYKIANPISLMDPPHRRRKLPKCLSLENFVRMMHYNHPPDIQGYLNFISDTGCRVGELVNLIPEDIEHGPDGYIVRLNGKTGERLVPIFESTFYSIQPYIPINHQPNWMSRKITRAFKDAGVKGTAHSLRHTFCSLWDGSEAALQQITGHTNMATLSIYRHLRMHQVSVEHEKYSMVKYL
jgi:integrase